MLLLGLAIASIAKDLAPPGPNRSKWTGESGIYDFDGLKLTSDDVVYWLPTGWYILTRTSTPTVHAGGRLMCAMPLILPDERLTDDSPLRTMECETSCYGRVLSDPR